MEVCHNRVFHNVRLDLCCHFSPSLDAPVLSPCILSVAVCAQKERYWLSADTMSGADNLSQSLTQCDMVPFFNHGLCAWTKDRQTEKNITTVVKQCTSSKSGKNKLVTCHPYLLSDGAPFPAQIYLCHIRVEVSLWANPSLCYSPSGSCKGLVASHNMGLCQDLWDQEVLEEWNNWRIVRNLQKRDLSAKGDNQHRTEIHLFHSACLMVLGQAATRFSHRKGFAV